MGASWVVALEGGALCPSSFDTLVGYDTHLNFCVPLASEIYLLYYILNCMTTAALEPFQPVTAHSCRAP